MTPMIRCRLGRHDLFAIGWGVGRCRRRCRVAFHQNTWNRKLRRSLDAWTRAIAIPEQEAAK